MADAALHACCFSVLTAQGSEPCCQACPQQGQLRKVGALTKVTELVRGRAGTHTWSGPEAQAPSCIFCPPQRRWCLRLQRVNLSGGPQGKSGGLHPDVHQVFTSSASRSWLPSTQSHCPSPGRGCSPWSSWPPFPSRAWPLQSVLTLPLRTQSLTWRENRPEEAKWHGAHLSCD